MTEAHIRIDEGIKRGPKSQGGRGTGKRRRNPVTGLVQAIPPGLKPEEVLKRYLTEQTTSQIAQSYGVSRKSLVAWLREVAPKEWKQVQVIRALDRKEKGTEEIEDANNPLSLARGRETVKASQWELERLDSDYALKQEVTVKQEVMIDTVLDGLADQLLAKIRGNTALQDNSQVIDVVDNDKT